MTGNAVGPADDFRASCWSAPVQAFSHDARSSTVTAIDWTSDNPGTGRYADVNGINLYYETHGSGRPLILLHGGLGSGEMFGPILPTLAERHQVIVPDLQGTAGPPTSTGRSISASWPMTSRRSSTTSGWTRPISSGTRSAAEWRCKPRGTYPP